MQIKQLTEETNSKNKSSKKQEITLSEEQQNNELKNDRKWNIID
jgi:hypothetical protein